MSASARADIEDDEQAIVDEERGDAGSAYPFYYGTPFDKLIVGAQIVFWWLITIPLIIWAFVRTLLLYLLLFAVFLVPLVLTTTFGLFLFLTTLYWTPAVSVALTQIAPLIAAAVQIGVFGLNVAWFILIALVDLWNILIPLFVVVLIYAIHFLLTVVTLIVRQLSSTDLTSLFSELIEVGFFFADLIVISFTVIVSVLPQALTITITIARPLLLLLFQVVVFLFPAVQFIFLTLFTFLPAVFFSVLKLVRIFSNLLRAAPLVAGALSYTPPSQSHRYEEGVATYFDSMMEHAHGLDWQTAIDQMEMIRAGQDTMPDYSHLPDPLDSANRRKRKRGDDHLPTSRGSLYVRYQNESATGRKRSLNDERFTREERAHVVGTALLDGLHSVVDHSAPLHTHRELMQRTLDAGAQRLFGYASATHALNDYNARYSHPLQLLLAHTPDLHNSWLGRAVRDSNPDDPFNAGMTWHDWRRAGYPPVQDHPNEREVNEHITRHQPGVMEYGRKRMRAERAVNATRQRRGDAPRLDFEAVQPPDTGLPEGDVPLPFEMPVVLGTDCFRSKPKFILCLPRPKPRRFKAPDILIPTNLPDPATCPGFIAPPNPDDGIDAVLEMLNPWIALQNTWVYLRYVISAFSSLFYAINEQSISSPWAGWFFDLLTIGDSSDDPISTDELFCLIPFAWYPFYLASLLILSIGFFLPLLWLIISLVVYITLPFRKTYALISGLLLYYRISGDRVLVLRTRSATDVSRQKWLRDRAVIEEGRGAMPALPGSVPGDSVGQYEHLNSLRFDEGLIKSDANLQDVHLLYTITQQLRQARTARQAAARIMHGLADRAHAMGALSRHVQSRNDVRLHMSQSMQHFPLMPHTHTLAHTQDLLRNVEVALGHRPLEDAVPVAHWDDN